MLKINSNLAFRIFTRKYLDMRSMERACHCLNNSTNASQLVVIKSASKRSLWLWKSVHPFLQGLQSFNEILVETRALVRVRSSSLNG